MVWRVELWETFLPFGVDYLEAFFYFIGLMRTKRTKIYF